MAGKSWYHKSADKYVIKFYDAENKLVVFKMPYYNRYQKILQKYPGIRAAWVEVRTAKGSLKSNTRVK